MNIRFVGRRAVIFEGLWRLIIVPSPVEVETETLASYIIEGGGGEIEYITPDPAQVDTETTVTVLIVATAVAEADTETILTDLIRSTAIAEVDCETSVTVSLAIVATD